MTSGSLLAYVFFAPFIGVVSAIIVGLISLFILGINESGFFAKVADRSFYVVLVCVLLSEIVFGALHTGARLDRKVEMEKQAQAQNERLFELGVQSEKKFCHEAGSIYREPFWGKIYNRVDSAKVMLFQKTDTFFCCDENGYLHELAPPICNRLDFHKCK